MQYINHIGYCGRDDSSDYLAHYGVKGMKWDPRKIKRRFPADIDPEKTRRRKEVIDNLSWYTTETHGSSPRGQIDKIGRKAAARAYTGMANAIGTLHGHNRKDDRVRTSVHYSINGGGSSTSAYPSVEAANKDMERKFREQKGRRVAGQLKDIAKKKQSVSLDELKKRKKLYNSWSKK